MDSKSNHQEPIAIVGMGKSLLSQIHMDTSDGS